MAPFKESLAQRVARFVDRQPDWDAFADARVEGYRRAQHRFIGAGASDKVDDPRIVPAEHFTLSIMFVPPGQGNAAHRHEVEEVLFILQGKVLVFVEDGEGQRAETVLGPWERPSRLPECGPRAGVSPSDAREGSPRPHDLRLSRPPGAPRRAPGRASGLTPLRATA